MPRKFKISNLRRRAEARLRAQQKGQPSKTPARNSDADTERLLHELGVHQIELEMQNVELQDANHELEAALAKYTDLYEFAPVGYLSMDESGLILESNMTGAALLGVERSQLVSRHLSRFMASSSLPTFLDFLKKTFTEPKSQACEVLLLKEDGGTFWASFRAKSTISHEGGGKLCRSAFGDISARNQMATKLTKRELEVLRLIAVGHANKQSASDLGISKRTVEKHRTHLMQKLNIHDTAGLTRYAINLGLTKDSVRLTIF